MARKSKYNENFPALAKGYAREGLTDKQIAKKLGVSCKTFYDYQKLYPQFLNSIKEGKAPVDTEVENALLKRAMGFEYDEVQVECRLGVKVSEKTTTKSVAPDVGACIFWLKNRKREVWKDGKSLEMTGKDGGAIVVEQDLNNLTTEELQKLLELSKKMSGDK